MGDKKEMEKEDSITFFNDIKIVSYDYVVNQFITDYFSLVITSFDSTELFSFGFS